MSVFLDANTVEKLLLTNVEKLKQDKGWKCEIRPMYKTKSKDNFASILYIADLINDHRGKTMSFAVKVMPEGQGVRDFQSSIDQFYNEDVIFRRIIPLMMHHSKVCDRTAVSSLVPKCYYASHEPDTAMIVMDNLAVEGYKLGNFLLDYEHCRLAMEGLARFHALSYAMKHNHGDVFKTRVVGIVREARFNKVYCGKYNNACLQYTGTDPIRYIQNSKEPDLVEFRRENEEYLKQLEDLLKNPTALMEELIVPEEPLAVLTHGDINRNNLMYRYDRQGHPVQVKFLDFQTVRYSNPATDFVFFAYFNMSPELRRDHLDDLLRCYQRVLVDALVEETGQPREQLETVFSLQAFTNDFKRRAMMGYIISASFIHTMMATVDELDLLDGWLDAPGEDELPTEQFLRDVTKLGGEDAIKRSVAIIKDMAAMHRV